MSGALAEPQLAAAAETLRDTYPDWDAAAKRAERRRLSEYGRERRLG